MSKESNNKFNYFKKQTLQKLVQHIEQDKVDEKVQVILKLINSHDNYVTTSSCAGRIVLMQLPDVGDKKHAGFLGRWHDPVSFYEIEEAVSRYKRGQLWFIAQSPIFHVAARTTIDADRLLKIGISSSFKHSGYKTETPKVIVELCSTERMDVPLVKEDHRFLSNDFLEFLTGIGNELLIRSQKKLNRLEQNLRKKINR